jgi:serine acetyltransferase
VIHEHVQIGEDCAVMDNAVLMPNVRLGDRVTIKPNATVGADGFEVREYIGIGSVVVRPIAPHALAYGSPARQHGWVCSCRDKLEFDAGEAACSRCGRGWIERPDGISESGAGS